MEKAKKVYILLVLLLLSTSLLAQSDIVAFINGEPITKQEWDREANVIKLLIDIKNSNETLYNILTNSEEGLKLIDKYRLEILNGYIKKVLLIQFAKSLGIKFDETQIRKFVDEQIQQVLKSSNVTLEQFEKFLVDSGNGTLQEYKEKLYFQRYYSVAISEVYALYTSRIQISEDELKKYYESVKQTLTLPTQYELYVFKTQNRNSAQRIFLDLSNNEPEDKVERTYSMKDTYLGYVNERDVTKLPLNVWVYVVGVSKNRVIQPIQVGTDFYVVKVKNVVIGATPPYESVRDKLTTDLYSKKANEVKDKVVQDFDEFVRKSKIEIVYKQSK